MVVEGQTAFLLSKSRSCEGNVCGVGCVSWEGDDKTKVMRENQSDSQTAQSAAVERGGRVENKWERRLCFPLRSCHLGRCELKEEETWWLSTCQKDGQKVGGSNKSEATFTRHHVLHQTQRF